MGFEMRTPSRSMNWEITHSVTCWSNACFNFQTCFVWKFWCHFMVWNLQMNRIGNKMSIYKRKKEKEMKKQGKSW